MSKANLKKDEKVLLEGFESGEFKSTLAKKRKEFLKSVAEAAFTKDKRINIRISGRDLESIQRRALEEGIPYQTLVSSIAHKYVSGSLKNTAANKRFGL